MARDGVRILVTNASGANGNGYGAVLGFGSEGDFTGPFCQRPSSRFRGFGFGPDERLYLSSGVGPSGEGDNTIVVFDRSGALLTPRLVTDRKLSPLDLKLAPNGNIVVASEWPLGAADAAPSVREYHPITGQLVCVFAPETLGRISQAAGIAVRARWPPVLRRGGPRRGLRFPHRIPLVPTDPASSAPPKAEVCS